jgi:hypothetical protein
MLKIIKTREIDFSRPINANAKELIILLLKYNAKDRPDLKAVFQSKFVREAIQSIDPSLVKKEEQKIEKGPSPLLTNISHVLSRQQAMSPAPNVYIKHTYTPLQKSSSTVSIAKPEKLGFVPIYLDKKIKMTESSHNLPTNLCQTHRQLGQANSNQETQPLSQSQCFPTTSSKSVVTINRMNNPEIKSSVFSGLKNITANFNTHREATKFSTPIMTKTSPMFYTLTRDLQQQKKPTIEASNTTPMVHKYTTTNVSRTNSIENTPMMEGRRARRIEQLSYCSFVNEPSITRNDSIVSHSPGVTIIRHFSSSLIPRNLQESTLPKNENTPMPSERSTSKNNIQSDNFGPTKFIMSFNENSRSENKMPVQTEKTHKDLPTARNTVVNHTLQKSTDHNIYSRPKINLGGIESSIFKNLKTTAFVEENTNIYQKTAKIVVGQARNEVRKPDLKMSFGGNIHISRRYQL